MQKIVVNYTVIAIIIYWMFYTLIGFLTSFGENPNSLNFIGILKYLFVYGIPIIAREFIRVNLVRNTKFNSKFIYIIIALTICVSEFNVFTFLRKISSISMFIEDFISIIMPIIIKNIVFTFIAKYTNVLPGILYSLSNKLFLWIIPIYPNIPWIVKVIFDSTLLISLYLCIRYAIQKEMRIFTRDMIKEFNPKKIIIFMCVFLIIICFGLGIFRYSPYSILSNSMYPNLEKGDLIIIDKCKIQTLKIGDIIQYKQEGKKIVHRIVDILDENGETYIITKGDNNFHVDEIKVNKDIFVGKVIFKIKYLGLPSIWINELK